MTPFFIKGGVFNELIALFLFFLISIEANCEYYEFNLRSRSKKLLSNPIKITIFVVCPSQNHLFLAILLGGKHLKSMQKRISGVPFLTRTDFS